MNAPAHFTPAPFDLNAGHMEAQGSVLDAAERLNSQADAFLAALARRDAQRERRALGNDPQMIEVRNGL